MDIVGSTEAYEAFLRAELGEEVVEEGLEEKHRKMAGEGAFPFLRATYWRWAERVPASAGDLAAAPAVLAVGDIHLENFGTWRDADGESADESVDLRLVGEGPGSTLLILRHTGPWPDDAPAENYRQGWDDTLDALEALLSR